MKRTASTLAALALTLWALAALAANGQDGPPAPRRETFERANNKAVVLSFDNPIDRVMASSVARRLQEAREMGASVVIVRFDTPGGLVSASRDLANLFLETTDLYLVAYVDREAISGGALVAFACDEIVMHSLGSIGDVLPVVAGPDGVPKRVGTKIETYVSELFQIISEVRGYDHLILRAMVNPDLKVWMLTDPETGEVARTIVDAEYRLAQEELDAQYKPELLIDAGQVLTLSARRAERLGLTTRLLDNDAQVFDYLGVTNRPPPVLGFNPSERMLYFLNAIAPLLLAVGMVAAYVAITTPGTGVPEAVAAVALVVAFSSQALVGYEVGWALLVIFLGIALLAVELFVIPGFGITGILGIACVAGGILISFIPRGFSPGVPADMTYLWGAVLRTLITLGLATLGLLLVTIYLPRSRFSTPFMLTPTATVPKPQSVDALMGPRPVPSQSAAEFEAAIVGKRGVTITRLRPSGLANFDGARYDVVTKGEYIDKGVPVRVDALEGMRIVVSQDTGETASASE